MAANKPLSYTSRSHDIFSTDLSSSSSLGKRGAAEAALDSHPGPGPSRKPGGVAGMSVSTLQRRVLDLESKQRDLENENEDIRAENERLKGERKVLLDGETHERQTGEEREQEWSDERVRLNTQLKELRSKNSDLSNSLASLRSEHAQLSNQHSSLTNNTSSEIQLLSVRLSELENERDRLKGWERRAKGLSIELEEEKRRTEEKRTKREDDTEDRKMEDVVRKELKRQAQYLVSLERNHAVLQTEVLDLRQKRKDADAAERATKDIERALRDEIRVLQEQLERSRRDMDSLTQTFPSESSSPAPDASVLQQRLQTLSSLHTQATSELAAKETENRSLHARLSELAQSSTTTIVELNKRVEEAQRELRWAKEGRVSAERREDLARREVEALQSGSGYSSSTSTTGNEAARVAQLETLVQLYKSQLDEISRDSREVEDRLTEGAGLVKQSALDEAKEKISQLERDNEALDNTINVLTAANTTLDAEVNDLMRRVASGEYNPAVERCLELRNGPAQKIRLIRMKELEDLKRENQALLDRLKGSIPATGADGKDGGGDRLVPRESWERVVKEKEELEKAHAKRLLRLKEIFGTKSKEFLEAVYSLLGWRIKFDESGADIRLTSMYAPKGKMGLTLKFASQEGHFGTMQMTGAMAKGLEDTRHFWIVERQSVPGFLAQVTTEMFEKTTIGRAAGYVGLE